MNRSAIDAPPLLLFREESATLSDEVRVLHLRSRLADLSEEVRDSFLELSLAFDGLPDDQWLKSPYLFRQRRFDRFRVSSSASSPEITLLPHSKFYQTEEINSYAGGVDRTFEALEAKTRENLVLRALMIDLLYRVPREVRLRSPYWEVGVHLIRVIARESQPGFPSPEGMHRDGHAFTTITLIKRKNVEGGVSRFADRSGVVGQEFTLREELETVIFNDAKGLHDVTPITVLNSGLGVRDVCGFSLNPIA